MACPCPSPPTLNDPEGRSVPIKFPFTEGMRPGMVLNVIASTTHETAFNIYDSPGNIIMGVCVRIHSNQIALNTHHGGWGVENTIKESPIKSGVKYCLHIVYQTEGYHIFLNGEEIYFYKHRMYDPASYLDINTGGKVFFFSYKLDEPKWAIHQPNVVIINQDFGVSGIDSPYNTQLQGRNKLSWIVIIGIINCKANRVTFNLLSSCDDTIFHLNPRFTDNCVVRNSCIGGAWGNEEISGAMVFQKNQKFVLAIDIEEHWYKTYMNGEEHIIYKHRKPANTVTKLQISKDVKVFKIIYKK